LATNGPTRSTTLTNSTSSQHKKSTDTTVRKPRSSPVPSDSVAEIHRLEQELREMKRANEIPKRAASFFGAELDRQHKM